MTTAALLISALIVAGLRLAYQAGKAEGFIKGLQVMEEAQCGHIVGTQNKRNE